MSRPPPSSPGLSPSPLVVQTGPHTRIVLVKLSSLGDVVHSLPLVQSLRAGLGPDVFLGWAVSAKFTDLVHGNPHVSRVYPLAKKSLGPLWQLGQTLQRDHFEIALDAQGLLASGVAAKLSGAKTRIGWDSNREQNARFLTHATVPGTHRAHIVDKLMGFCDALGVPRLLPAPQTYLADGQRAPAQALLEAARGGDSAPLVGFIVGASVANKAWPVERWAELAKSLSAQGLRPVLLGGPTETETADEIMRQNSGAVALNVAGKTPIPLLASVLAQCAVVVGGDSGPTHLAVAVGTPVVGLYGVTDPARTGPHWGHAPAVVLDFAESDAPPALRRPRHPALPDALARIPASAAASAVNELLRVCPHPRPLSPVSDFVGGRGETAFLCFV